MWQPQDNLQELVLSLMGVSGVELRVSGLAEAFTQSPLGPYFIIFI